jgi:hypothetical protein
MLHEKFRKATEWEGGLTWPQNGRSVRFLRKMTCADRLTDDKICANRVMNWRYLEKLRRCNIALIISYQKSGAICNATGELPRSSLSYCKTRSWCCHLPLMLDCSEASQSVASCAVRWGQLRSCMLSFGTLDNPTIQNLSPWPKVGQLSCLLTYEKDDRCSASRRRDITTRR